MRGRAAVYPSWLRSAGPTTCAASTEASSWGWRCCSLRFRPGSSVFSCLTRLRRAPWRFRPLRQTAAPCRRMRASGWPSGASRTSSSSLPAISLPMLAMLSVAYEGLQGRRASFARGIARALRVLPANAGLAIACALGICFASLLLVVPGLILLARWSVALPALMIERTGVMESLARSRDLTRGRRWTVLGFLVLVAAFNGALFLVLVAFAKPAGGSGRRRARSGDAVRAQLGRDRRDRRPRGRGARRRSMSASPMRRRMRQARDLRTRRPESTPSGTAAVGVRRGRRTSPAAPPSAPFPWRFAADLPQRKPVSAA